MPSRSAAIFLRSWSDEIYRTVFIEVCRRNADRVRGRKAARLAAGRAVRRRDLARGLDRGRCSL